VRVLVYVFVGGLVNRSLAWHLLHLALLTSRAFEIAMALLP